MYNDYYDNGAAIAGLFVVFLISLLFALAVSYTHLTLPTTPYV